VWLANIRAAGLAMVLYGSISFTFSLWELG
jgi:hypothetical protein